MPSSLEKTRKQIAKKKGGTIGALHQYSRNSKRIHRAVVRDERLGKLAAARRKNEEPLLERVAYLLEAVRENDGGALDMDTIRSTITGFVRQYDEEYDEAKKARRPGRPPSAREDLLKLRIANLEKEQQNGFYMPDLSSADNVALLDSWEGSWAYLTTLAWVKVSSAGVVKASSFPPNGNS